MESYVHQKSILGKWDEARAFYEEVKQFRWMGSKKTFQPGQAIKWDSFNHTPQIWVPNMRAVPVWPREMWDDLPIAHNLEKHYETLKKEVSIVVLCGCFAECMAVGKCREVNRLANHEL